MRLRHVRERFASDKEEFTGCDCIGAAIRDHAGAVIGSISCSMPTIRAEGEHLASVVNALRHTTTKVSEVLGGSPEPAQANSDAA